MRVLKPVLAAVVAAVVLAVGGTYAYINFLRDDPPEKLALQADDSGPAAAGSEGTVAGTWKATSGSEAGYRVDEVLFGQNATAVGRTSDVTGELTVEGTRVTRASIVVDMATVKSDQARRDGQFKGRIMSVDRFPTARFTLTDPIELGAAPAPGAVLTRQATGKLTLRGTTRSVTVKLDAKRTGDAFQVQGSIPIVFAEWGIPNPSFGPVTTEDRGELEFLVTFRRTAG